MVVIPTARDAMSRWTVSFSPDTDSLEAVELLVRRRVSGAPVIDEDGNLLGVLTEKDCLRLISHSASGELQGRTIKSYMSAVKVTLTADMDLFGVANVFLQTNFPVLPVLEEGKPVGQISRLELLRLVLELDRDMQKERGREEQDLWERENPTSIDRLQKLAGSHTPQQLAEVLRNRKRYKEP